VVLADRGLELSVAPGDLPELRAAGKRRLEIGGPDSRALDVQEGPQHGRREVPRAEDPGEVPAGRRDGRPDRPVHEEPVGHRRERLASRDGEGKQGDPLGQLGERQDVKPRDAAEGGCEARPESRAQQPARDDQEQRAPGVPLAERADVIDEPRLEPPHRKPAMPASLSLRAGSLTNCTGFPEPAAPGSDANLPDRSARRGERPYAPMVRVLFEILPATDQGPSIMPAMKH
jgi:hypothetical protein